MNSVWELYSPLSKFCATMTEIFNQEFRIRYSEGDRFGRLKLRSLFDYTQEAAGNHAAALGVGMEQLRSEGMAWVLSRIKFRVSQYPTIGSRIRVETWPAAAERLFARRELRFYLEDGTEFAAATSLWLLVDTRELRIISVTKALAGKLPEVTERDIAFTDIGKIRPQGGEEIAEYFVRERLLDINEHLNNAEYAGFVQDCLGAGCYPAQFQFNYQKSVPLGAKLVFTGMRDEQSFSFAASVDGVTHFEAEGNIIPNP